MRASTNCALRRHAAILTVCDYRLLYEVTVDFAITFEILATLTTSD